MDDGPTSGSSGLGGRMTGPITQSGRSERHGRAGSRCTVGVCRGAVSTGANLIPRAGSSSRSVTVKVAPWRASGRGTQPIRVSSSA